MEVGFKKGFDEMLILSQNINKPGGIRIRTGSGDIWLAVLPGTSNGVCKIAIEAPHEYEILRSELVDKKTIERDCGEKMAELLFTGLPPNKTVPEKKSNSYKKKPSDHKQHRGSQPKRVSIK